VCNWPAMELNPEQITGLSETHGYVSYTIHFIFDQFFLCGCVNDCVMGVGCTGYRLGKPRIPDG